MIIDTRLVGETAENIFLSLLNTKGVFAASFDRLGFDGIVFDLEKKFFKIGKSPLYVQIKYRKSKKVSYCTQGHEDFVINNIKATAQKFQIPESSLYFVVGFGRNDDIRDSIFFGIPFRSLKLFHTTRTYRFSVNRCQELISSKNHIFSL